MLLLLFDFHLVGSISIAPVWVHDTYLNLLRVWVVVYCRCCLGCEYDVGVHIVLDPGFAVFHDSATCKLVLGLVSYGFRLTYFHHRKIFRWVLPSWWFHHVDVKSCSFTIQLVTTFNTILIQVALSWNLCWF